MTLEQFAKFAAICFGAVTAWNVIIGLLKGRKSQLRDEYRFAREFIADLEGVAKDSPFLQQKGCYALTGNATVDFPALQYMLGLSNPEACIRDYSFGYAYIEHVVTAQDAPIRFKRQFQNGRKRFLIKFFFLLSYLVTYLLGFSPLLLHTLKIWGPTSPLPTFFVTATIFFPAAYLSIKAGVRLRRAEKLIEHQSTRSNNSFKPTPHRSVSHMPTLR